MEGLFVLIGIFVAWPFVKGCCLFFLDHDEWKRVRQREHEQRLENKRTAGGLIGLVGKLFK